MNKGLLDIWNARYAPNGSTVADLMAFAEVATVKRRKKPAAPLPPPKTKRGRHVTFTPGTEYELLREGRALANVDAIDTLLRTKECDESYFYLFRHCDRQHRARNPLVPVYEAAYYCTETRHYVRVQKCHLKQAYARAQRMDATLADTLLEDGVLPYWVDRHGRKSTLHKKRKQ